jgi:hypothetical protein
MKDIFDKDDAQLISLPPPEEDEKLITVGNQMSIPECLNLYRKSKRGKKTLKDFM